jgi:REP element-mobilizing transposase RayT
VARIEPMTTWHVTFGTYGTRLHGNDRPTVDRRNNRVGQPFLGRDEQRRAREQSRLRSSPISLTDEQRELIEGVLPQLCARGGWVLRAVAAGWDHVHVVCDAPSAVHGKQVRRLVKRWLTQVLNERWPRSRGSAWWAEGGSTKAVKDPAYLASAVAYVRRQRFVGGEGGRAGDGPAR